MPTSYYHSRMPGLLRLLLWHLLQVFVVNTAEAVLVNVTVDDSALDPVTGKSMKYVPPRSWKSGFMCTDCIAAFVEAGSMFNRTWHEGVYFADNSTLNSTGSLSTTFTFSGTAIYVFCALALSVSNPSGYSNMSFFIDNEPVGQFEWVPPGQQGYQYNVSVYANTSIPAGVHLFRLQNGPNSTLGNESLALVDYLVYSYDDGKPATATESASTSSTASASTLPAMRTSSSPAGAIAGSVIGGIVGLSVLGFLIWFLIRRRISRTNEKTPLSPDNNAAIPDPFTQSEPERGPSNPTGLAQTSGYGIGIRKDDISRQQQLTPTSASSSTPATTAVNPSSSGSPPVSAGIPGRPERQQETDAGPIVLERENEGQDTLPPQYAQVFASSNTRAAPQPSIVVSPTKHDA